MGLFGENPFDDFFESFFRSNDDFLTSSENGKKSFRRTSVNKLQNFIESGKNIYFVLDLSNLRDINIKIKDKLITNDFGEKVTNGRKILEITSSNGEILNYILPKKIKTKNFDWKFNNGILEVIFRK